MRPHFYILLCCLALAHAATSAPEVAKKDSSSKSAKPEAEASATNSGAKSESATAKTPSTEAPEDGDIREGPDATEVKRPAAVSTIAPEELANFEHYAPQIQQLIRNALDLTKLNLTYTFGSANPSQGGMDCSGTIFHLLQGLGIKGVPRQSDEICGWVQDHTLLHRITEADVLKHAEFYALQPGDLLFWSGTYASPPRKIPVTHVMLYLGKLEKGGKHVVFGASDGRVYEGKRRTGVSVFDFTLPKAGSKTTFYGYGLIPGIGKAQVKSLDPVTIAAANVSEVITPPKEPLEAKEGIKPLKTDAAPATEEIRRAAPASESASPAAPKDGGAAKKSSATGAKSKTKSKAKSSSARPKRSTANHTPAPTTRQRFENAAAKMAHSIRNALPD